MLNESAYIWPLASAYTQDVGKGNLLSGVSAVVSSYGLELRKRILISICVAMDFTTNR